MSSHALSQSLQPPSLAGRAIGALLEPFSDTNDRWVMAQLESVAPRSYLEIGFGTGKLATTVADRFRPQQLVGVDPSPMMVAIAHKRLVRFAGTMELCEGDDTLLRAIEGPFDVIVTVHSFQFWRYPAATLTHVRELLAPGGAFVLVLKSHEEKDADRLPNPISTSGDELAGTRAALTQAGFHITVDEALKTGSRGLVAGLRSNVVRFASGGNGEIRR